MKCNLCNRYNGSAPKEKAEIEDEFLRLKKSKKGGYIVSDMRDLARERKAK